MNIEVSRKPCWDCWGLLLRTNKVPSLALTFVLGVATKQHNYFSRVLFFLVVICGWFVEISVEIESTSKSVEIVRPDLALSVGGHIVDDGE